jgi:hypothetical protein
MIVTNENASILTVCQFGCSARRSAEYCTRRAARGSSSRQPTATAVVARRRRPDELMIISAAGTLRTDAVQLARSGRDEVFG